MSDLRPVSVTVAGASLSLLVRPDTVDDYVVREVVKTVFEPVAANFEVLQQNTTITTDHRLETDSAVLETFYATNPQSPEPRAEKVH